MQTIFEVVNKCFIWFIYGRIYFFSKLFPIFLVQQSTLFIWAQRQVRSTERYPNLLLALVLKKPHKNKVIFLRPYPPPLELSGHIFLGIFFLELQIKYLFLSGQALTFFAAFLRSLFLLYMMSALMVALMVTLRHHVIEEPRLAGRRLTGPFI